MKHLLRLTIPVLAIVIFTLPSFALVLPSSTTEPVKKENSTSGPLSNLTVNDFLSLTPAKFKEMTGQKMSLSQKVALKMAQHKLRKEIRSKGNETLNVPPDAVNAVNTSDFNIGGFILGLLLSIFGVLIAYLIGDSDVIKWAWIGFGISAIIYLLVLIL